MGYCFLPIFFKRKTMDVCLGCFEKLISKPYFQKHVYFRTKKKSFIRIYSKNSCFQKTKFSKQKQKLRNNTKEPVNHKVGSNIEFRCMYTNLKPYMSRSQVDTDPTQTRAGPPITFLVSTFGITYILWAHLTIFIELSGFHLRSRVKKLFFIRNENK